MNYELKKIKIKVTPNTKYINRVKPNCYTNIVNIKHGIRNSR